MEKFFKHGRVWQKVNGSMVGEDFKEVATDMVSNEEDDIGGGVIAEAGQEQDGFEGSLEGSNSEEEDDVGDGVIGGDDSEVSMETHADGITSPINVLDRYISSSVSD